MLEFLLNSKSKWFLRLLFSGYTLILAPIIVGAYCFYTKNPEVQRFLNNIQQAIGINSNEAEIMAKKYSRELQQLDDKVGTIVNQNK